MAVVEYRTKLAAPRRGLCSTWMARLAAGERVRLWIRSGTMIFPADPVRSWNTDSIQVSGLPLVEPLAKLSKPQAEISE